MKNKTKWSTLLLAFSFTSSLSAQTVSDVLENGQKLADGDALFFTFGTERPKSDYSNIQFAFSTGPKVPRTVPQVPSRDSFLLLPKTYNNLKVYVRPLNPLRYAYADTSYDLEDAIDKAAADAIAGMAQQWGKLIAGGPSANGEDPSVAAAAVGSDNCNLSAVQTAYDNAIAELKQEDRGAYKTTFEKLYNIGFTTPNATKDALAKAAADTINIRQHFKSLADRVDDLVKAIEAINCQSDKVFLYKHTIVSMLKEVKDQQQEQTERYVLLQKMFALFGRAYDEAMASTTDPASSEWYIERNTLSFPQHRVTFYELSLFEVGYHVKDGDIVPTAKKLIAKKTIRFRHFRRFIPEVSAGVAYTGLQYPQYKTDVDDAGNHYVASAGNDLVKRINFTAMINFNYFIPNAGLHPFFQLGAGTNLENPVLFTGFGTRIPVKSNQRFAVSVGAAFGFIKQLDKLKLGEKVIGEAALEQDLKLQLDPMPKLYVGFQIQL